MILKYRDKKWCFRTNFIINFSKKKKEKKERWGERKQVNGKKEKVGSRGEGRMFRSESMWVVSWHDSYTGFSLSLLVWQSVSSLSWRHYHMMPSSPLLSSFAHFYFSSLSFSSFSSVTLHIEPSNNLVNLLYSVDFNRVLNKYFNYFLL